MTKGKAAYLFATQTLGKEKLYMWTFTFAAVLDVKATRKKWNYHLTLLKRRWPKLAVCACLNYIRTTGCMSIW